MLLFYKLKWCLQILVDFVDEVERLEAKHADIKLQTAELLCSAVCEELIELPVICKLFVNGAGHPLGLQFLRSLIGQKSEEWLTAAFSAHNISCVQLLPGMCWVVLVYYRTMTRFLGFIWLHIVPVLE